MRKSAVVVFLVFYWFALSVSARAQLPFAPSWPISPTSPQQCAAFSADVDRYQSAVNQQHEDCLHAGKEDRPNQPPNSLICSRSSCQVLHDILFSDAMYTDVKYLRGRVGECYTEVKQYEDQQAREKQQAEQEEREREEADAARGAAQARNPVPQPSLAPSAQPIVNTPVISRQQQAPVQPYAATSARIPETPTPRDDRDDRGQQALSEMADPFGSSANSRPERNSTNSSEGVVDPFGNSSKDSAADGSSGDAKLVDPFADSHSKPLEGKSDKELAADKAKDIAFDKGKELVEERSKEAINALEGYLEEARSKLSSADFKAYRAEVKEAESYLRGLGRVLEVAPFIKDAWEASTDWQKGWNDFAHDCETKGFEAVLKRLSPTISKIWEGPAGWALSITFDPSRTQTPEQDFDPMTAINNPSRYTFGEREAALRKMYVSEATHPEVWNDSKRQWLRDLTVQVYNSPDNPNVHLTPQ